MRRNFSVLLWEATRSKVFLGEIDGVPVAKKVYTFQADLDNELWVYDFLHKCGMEHIPRVISSGRDCIYLEYIEGRILRKFISNSGYEDIYPYIKSGSVAAERIKDQLISIVRRLHEKGIAHGNLKQSQFIVDKTNSLYLLDFAGSIHKDDRNYEVYRKYDDRVIASYLTGAPSWRPSKLDFYVADIKKWTLSLFSK